MGLGRRVSVIVAVGEDGRWSRLRSFTGHRRPRPTLHEQRHDNRASTLLSPELLARLEKMELVSRKIFRGRMKGERRSRRKGQSVEFADFRNYVPGDDLRFIDWNTYARLDRLFLKMFLEEEDLHFYALIDASRVDGFRRADEAAIRQATGRRAGVHRPGARRSGEDRNARPAAPAPAPVFRGRRSLWRMLEHLERLPAGRNRVRWPRA